VIWREKHVEVTFWANNDNNSILYYIIIIIIIIIVTVLFSLKLYIVGKKNITPAVNVLRVQMNMDIKNAHPSLEFLKFCKHLPDTHLIIMV
jgi:hypothetical protein